MMKKKGNAVLRMSLSVLLVLCGTVSLAQAANFHVANNGVDSPTCGEVDAPCRSISRAIANANDRDKIVVGPGRYGDLNGNGTVEPGEEAAEVGFGCDCLIKVNKRLSLESSDGAGATMIDEGSTNVAHGIRIQVNGVIVGKKKKGFTFNRLLTIDHGTSDVTVEDNVCSGCDGISVNGSGHSVIGNLTTSLFVAGDDHTIRENFANGNGSNFIFVISGTGHLVTGNLVSFTGFGGVFGFMVDGSGHRITQNTTIGMPIGFEIDGTGHVLTGNVINNGAGYGIEVNGIDHQITENIITGYKSAGLHVSGFGHEVRRNFIVGNPGFGIIAETNAVTITGNNIFGNDTIVTSIGINCGLFNNTGTSLMAPNNFWGAASGPGPDPADAVCNSSSSTTTVAPVATHQFNIPASGGQ
jgi:hypothetical protein